jgi:hypothetical protein
MLEEWDSEAVCDGPCGPLGPAGTMRRWLAPRRSVPASARTGPPRQAGGATKSANCGPLRPHHSLHRPRNRRYCGRAGIRTREPLTGLAIFKTDCGGLLTRGDEANMSSDLVFCVSTLPLASPRFPANHGPNTDPFAVSKEFDHLALSRVAGSVHAGGTDRGDDMPSPFTGRSSGVSVARTLSSFRSGSYVARKSRTASISHNDSSARSAASTSSLRQQVDELLGLFAIALRARPTEGTGRHDYASLLPPFVH